jgi:hypothetical protein
MGWYNQHLYSFGDREFSIEELHEDSWGEPDADASKTQIFEFLRKKGDKLIYTYDFGDGWEHTVAVEKVLDAGAGNLPLPNCVDGVRTCPPEDCGGVPGYYNLLEVLGDSKHPEHEDMKEWIGDEFDPENFDLQAVNLRLHGGRRVAANE